MKINRVLSALVAVPFLALVHASEAAPIVFTTCGATGAMGPTQGACDAAYGGGVVAVAGGIQSWTAATAGTYRIIATGAAGASATMTQTGGRGAQVAADLVLSAGQILQLAIGQIGTAGFRGALSTGSGGGGGGSFVVDSANTALLVAGGGGGTRSGALVNGFDASTSQFGTTGSGNNLSGVGGGVQKVIHLGLGGIASSNSWGSAGAGFFGDGANDGQGSGGSSWANGLAGGTHIGSCSNEASADGGFGGGGAGQGC